MIALLNNWRAVVADLHEGIVVLDVTADSEHEAKNKAHEAAKYKLNCKDIQSLIVKRHTDMPAEWLSKKAKIVVH